MFIGSLYVQAAFPNDLRDAQPEAIPHDVVDRGSLDTSVVEPDYSSNVLEQRAPKMEWLNGRENRILRALARGIERKIYTTDLVLFLGNSGRYVLLPDRLRRDLGSKNLVSLIR